MLKIGSVQEFIWFLCILLWFTTPITSCTHRMAFGGCEYRVKTGECLKKVVLPDADLIATSYRAADHLIRNVSPALKPKSRLLVTSIADLDNLEDSTALGRLISEQMAARFAQRGYTVVEAKLQPKLFMIPRTGEFVLSRQLRDFGQRHQVNTVITGTSVVAKDKVYITLKMLNCRNSQVMSSYAYTLPLGSNTLTLLQKSFWWW